MTQLFGTDGIRGLANAELTPELAMAIGRAAAFHLSGAGQGPILIGRDPRLSGPMLAGALASGIASAGIDARLVGIVTTPCLAWLTKDTGAMAGAMLSASHNPMADNGIKFFNAYGCKLEEHQERAIENLYWQGTSNLPRPTGKNIGRIDCDKSLVNKYFDHLIATLNTPLQGLRVIIDCANGSASTIAARLAAAIGVTAEVIHAAPDGININCNCGSTQPASLAAAVKAIGADLGLALDGDADRLIAVDSRGALVDGDKIMLICANALKEQGRLSGDTLVTTVMSNLGLQLAAKRLGIKTVTTKVGDRFVFEAMQSGGYSLGGEQSGHIIFREYSNTGDGLLCALQLMQIMRGSGKSLEELAGIMDYLPQILINVPMADKHSWQANPLIAAKIAWAEKVLDQRGRVLVRPSGTEPLLRIMLEGPDSAELKAVAEAIAAVVKSEL